MITASLALFTAAMGGVQVGSPDHPDSSQPMLMVQRNPSSFYNFRIQGTGPYVVVSEANKSNSRLIHTASGRIVRRFEPCTFPVTLSKNGRFLVSAEDVNNLSWKVEVSDLVLGRQAGSFKQPSLDYWPEVSVTTDGSLVAIAFSNEGLVQVRKASNGELVDSIQRDFKVAQVIFDDQSRQCGILWADSCLQLWKANSGAPALLRLTERELQNWGLQRIAWCPSGESLLWHSDSGAALVDRGSVIWRTDRPLVDNRYSYNEETLGMAWLGTGQAVFVTPDGICKISRLGGTNQYETRLLPWGKSVEGPRFVAACPVTKKVVVELTSPRELICYNWQTHSFSWRADNGYSMSSFPAAQIAQNGNLLLVVQTGSNSPLMAIHMSDGSTAFTEDLKSAGPMKICRISPGYEVLLQLDSERIRTAIISDRLVWQSLTVAATPRNELWENGSLALKASVDKWLCRLGPFDAPQIVSLPSFCRSRTDSPKEPISLAATGGGTFLVDWRRTPALVQIIPELVRARELAFDPSGTRVACLIEGQSPEFLPEVDQIVIWSLAENRIISKTALPKPMKSLDSHWIQWVPGKDIVLLGSDEVLGTIDLRTKQTLANRKLERSERMQFVAWKADATGFLMIDTNLRIREVSLDNLGLGEPRERTNEDYELLGRLFKRERSSDDGKWRVDGEDGIDLVSGVDGATRLQCFVFQDGSWVVVSPDGRFDTSDLLKAQGVHWVMPGLIPVGITAFARERFTPGLLKKIWNNEDLPPMSPLGEKDVRTATLKLEGAVAKDGFIEVRVVADGNAAARDIRLFRNGQLVGWRDSASTEPFRFRAVDGDNNLAAYCFNASDVRSEVAEASVKATVPTAKPRAFVLAVGVDEYSGSALSRLSFAGADAKLAESRLKTMLPEAGFELASVKVLAGTVTKEEIREAIKAMAPLPTDMVVLFWAGHGFTDDKEFHLFPSNLPDGSLKDQAVLRASVSGTELEEWLRPLDAGRFLMIIDACHSAAAVESGGFKPAPIAARGLGQLAFDKQMLVVSASQSDQVALELNQTGHGLLSYALFAEAPREQTLGEWVKAAAQRTPQLWHDLKSGKLRGRGERMELPEAARPQTPALFEFGKATMATKLKASPAAEGS